MIEQSEQRFSAQSVDKGIARQMVERATNFLSALRKPAKRVGEKRSQRKFNPDFAAPERIIIERFDQLNKQDRWSRTEFRAPAPQRGSNPATGAHASISVQDPQDPDDLVCAPIPIVEALGGELELENHREKISHLSIDDISEQQLEALLLEGLASMKPGSTGPDA